jgi:plasmid stability protein
MGMGSRNLVSVMNQIVIRNLDDEILQGLKQIAWQDGRTPAEMAQRLLIDAVRSRASRRRMTFLERHNEQFVK